MRKHNKKASKHKIRMFFAVLIFGGITAILGYNLLSNVIAIEKLSDEKKALNEKITNLKEEKKNLETDILKLEDPEYIAKYVREKYLYSKEGEVILKIED